jgi:hypothetical protein
MSLKNMRESLYQRRIVPDLASEIDLTWINRTLSRQPGTDDIALHLTL